MHKSLLSRSAQPAFPRRHCTAVPGQEIFGVVASRRPVALVGRSSLLIDRLLPPRTFRTVLYLGLSFLLLVCLLRSTPSPVCGEGNIKHY